MMNFLAVGLGIEGILNSHQDGMDDDSTRPREVESIWSRRLFVIERLAKEEEDILFTF